MGLGRYRAVWVSAVIGQCASRPLQGRVGLGRYRAVWVSAVIVLWISGGGKSHAWSDIVRNAVAPYTTTP